MLDAPFERVEAMDAVWRAVEELNVDLKMALLLRDVVGLSYTEIADSLEITLATVKWRIYKAREEVQLALAREGITFGQTPRPHRIRRDAGRTPSPPRSRSHSASSRADSAGVSPRGSTSGRAVVSSGGVGYPASSPPRARPGRPATARARDQAQPRADAS